MTIIHVVREYMENGSDLLLVPDYPGPDAVGTLLVLYGEEGGAVFAVLIKDVHGLAVAHFVYVDNLQAGHLAVINLVDGVGVQHPLQVLHAVCFLCFSGMTIISCCILVFHVAFHVA